ncbi:MAG: hypothetical protein ACE366_04265 [Bradymonadia bacterium]
MRLALARPALTRCLLSIATALSVAACESESTSLKPDPGQVMIPDFEVYVDAGVDADLPDLDVDAEVWSPAAHPTYEEVALLKRGRSIYVFWYDGETVWSRVGDEQGNWQTEAERVVDLETPPAGMAAVELGSEPWLVFTGAEGRIQIWNPTEGGDPTTIDLLGAPLVAVTGANMYIFGQPLPRETDPEADMGVAPTDSDTLAWVRVNGQGEAAQVFRDTLSLPRPDSVVGVAGGAVMRFSEVGQCVQIVDDPAAPTPIGNFSCQLGRGRLDRNADKQTVAHLQERSEGIVYAMRPLFGPSKNFPFFLGLSADVNLTRFATGVDGWPLVLRALRPDPEDGPPVNGRLELVIAGAQGLYRSQQSWESWPYPGVRGFFLGSEMVPDPIEPALTTENFYAYGVRFGDRNDPDVVAIPMDEVEFEGETYGFLPNNNCDNPTPEVCDKVDNDCDGEIDNGLCCLVDPTPDATSPVDFWDLDLGGPMTEMILGDVLNRNAFDGVFRIGESLWESRKLFISFSGASAPLNGFRDPGSDAQNQATFSDMSHWGTSGGCGVMVGRQEPGGPIVARWIRSDLNGEPRPIQPPLELEGCSEVLSMDPTQPINNQPPLAVVVCPENMWRVYCYPDEELVALDPRLLIPPNRYDFAELLEDLPEGGTITWGTITRSEDVIRDIFVGYRNTEGRWRLRSFQFGRQGAEEITDLPVPIAAMQETEGPFPRPTYLYGIASGTQIEVQTGVMPENPPTPRVWVRGIADYQWVNVAPAPQPGDRVEFMAHPRFKRLIYGRPLEDGKIEFWAFNLTENFGVIPWASQPVFTFDPETEPLVNFRNDTVEPITIDEEHPIIWTTHKGRYEPSLVIGGFVRERTSNGEVIGETWRMSYKRLVCRDP